MQNLLSINRSFFGSESMDEDAIKYPKGKTETKLQRVELAERETVPLDYLPIPLLGNVDLCEKFSDKRVLKLLKTFI